MSQIAYRPDVDGLRAVSVVAVLLFHARLACPGGFVGVDVFFVISGFLITSLILRDLETGRFQLLDFWSRRVRRILPALTVCLLFTLVAGCLLMLPDDLLELARSGVAQSLFAANFHFWATLDYFAGRGERAPLLHTWSLAVEEQFYFVFPFVAYWLARRDRKRFTQLLWLVAAVSFVLSIIATHWKPSFAFYMLPTRAWELLCGSLIACHASRPGPDPRRAEWLSWLGLGAILSSIFLYDSTIEFPGLAAVPPCLGAALVIWSNTSHRTTVGQILAWRPVVFIGLISYSLYLWHWPIFAFLNYALREQATVAIRAGAAIAGVVLGGLSWWLVEQPFRKPRPGQTAGRVIAWGLLASAVPLALWAGIAATGGWQGRFSPQFRDYLATRRMSTTHRSLSLKTIEKGDLHPLGEPGSRPCFIVWGDSHAMALGAGFDELARELAVPGQLIVEQGTPPLLGSNRRHPDGEAGVNEAIVTRIAASGVKQVILCARWSYYALGGLDGGVDSLVFDSESRGFSRNEGKQAFARGLRRTVTALRDQGIEVWVLRQVPEPETNAAWSLAVGQVLGIQPTRGVTKAGFDARNAFVDQAVREAGIDADHYIDFGGAFFDEEGHIRDHDPDGIYYLDDNHLSRYGVSLLLGPQLRDLLRGIGDSCAATR